MNRRILAAKALLATAKAILASKDYIWDPDHRKRPEGGGWEKTEKGWTQKKRQKSSEKKTGKALSDVPEVPYEVLTNEEGYPIDPSGYPSEEANIGYIQQADGERLQEAMNWQAHEGMDFGVDIYKAAFKNKNFPKGFLEKYARAKDEDEVGQLCVDAGFDDGDASWNLSKKEYREVLQPYAMKILTREVANRK